jgi:hypothetical protein
MTAPITNPAGLWLVKKARMPSANPRFSVILRTKKFM